MKRRKRKKIGYVLRKIMHLFLSGSIAIGALHVPQSWFVPIAITLFVAILFFELVRLKTSAKKLVNTTFDPMLKKSERGKFTGIFWAAFAGLLVAPLATPETLSYAFAIFAVADPAAALVGKYTKSRKIYGNKTVNGSLAFLVGAFLVSWLYFFILQTGNGFILISVLLAIFLTIVEVFSDPIDDNFSLLVFATILMRGLI